MIHLVMGEEYSYKMPWLIDDSMRQVNVELGMHPPRSIMTWLEESNVSYAVITTWTDPPNTWFLGKRPETKQMASVYFKPEDEAVATAFKLAFS